MGQMVKRTYVGAFIEVRNDNFQELWKDDEFYCSVVENRFITAYQGMEMINVLVPIDDKYSEICTTGEGNEDEFILTAFNPENRLENFENDFKEIIIEIKKTFPDIELKYGLISFWDEI